MDIINKEVLDLIQCTSNCLFNTVSALSIKNKSGEPLDADSKERYKDQFVGFIVIVDEEEFCVGGFDINKGSFLYKSVAKFPWKMYKIDGVDFKSISLRSEQKWSLV